MMDPCHPRHPTINLQTILKANPLCILAKDINHILMDNRHPSLEDTTTLHHPHHTAVASTILHNNMVVASTIMELQCVGSYRVSRDRAWVSMR